MSAKRTLIIAILCLIALISSGCSLRSLTRGTVVKVDAVKGDTVTTKGDTDHFTFFTSATTYQTIASDKKYLLAENYVVDSPNGIKIESATMKVSIEETSKSDSKYDAYFIESDLSLRIPEDLPNGEYLVNIRFPNVIEVRDVLQANSPKEEPRISLKVRVYETLEDLANANWRTNLLIFSVLTLIGLIGLKIDNDYTMLAGGAAALISLLYIFRCVKFLWILSPLVSIFVALNFVLSMNAAYRKVLNRGE